MGTVYLCRLPKHFFPVGLVLTYASLNAKTQQHVLPISISSLITKQWCS